MKPKENRGTWGMRFLIKLFTVLLAILIYWLLGFLVEDIESIDGPDYAKIEREFVDQSLVKSKEQVTMQVAEVNREIANRQEQQRLAGDSSQNLQRTINQLLELQKLSIQKDVSLSEAEQNNLTVSLNHFLQSQKEYQELNKAIADLTSKKTELDDRKLALEEQIAAQQKPASEEFSKQIETHRLWLAFYQLLVLVPLLAIAAYLLIRKRASIYYPLFIAFGAATLLKVALVLHEYFPSQYFKYVLIVGLLAVVARLLVYFIRVIRFPKADWLLRQYREAYERFLCPVCEYPIRTGPRKFLYWTRSTVHKILPPAATSGSEETYSCPSCGTALFEECPHCHKTRHSMLEHCKHCGTKKSVAPVI